MGLNGAGYAVLNGMVAVKVIIGLVTVTMKMIVMTK